MKQTKLSKQQKKIIMILGKNYYESKKKGRSPGVHRIKLKREATNTPSRHYIDWKPMTNSARASATRSLKRLRKRGVIKQVSVSIGYHNEHTLTKEGIKTYKELKKEKNK